MYPRHEVNTIVHKFVLPLLKERLTRLAITTMKRMTTWATNTMTSGRLRDVRMETPDALSIMFMILVVAQTL